MSSNEKSEQEKLSQEMKSAMRSLGATVCIISSAKEDTHYAMTATAISSLSLDPPALLVCVNRDTGLHEALSAHNDFCVNALHFHQKPLSENCAWKLSAEERFKEGNWAISENGTPYLTDAQVAIHCHMDGSYDYGSHTIFIGKIHQIDNADDVDPLLYLNGTYFAHKP
jgi:flavin reductase (DIM6/NTAB) family NADH-FMN oxidoreductase RutF